MTDLVVQNLLDTNSLAVRGVVCDGRCRHRGPEECSAATTIVFPYRGIYARHLGRDEVIAEPNQVLFFNRSESYRISHPVEGGDACLSIVVREDLLRELVPREHLHDGDVVAFRKQRLGIDPRAQVLMALLRHSLLTNAIETLEAETLTLTLIRRALGERAAQATRESYGRQKLVDRAKLVLSSDVSRRWTLAEIGAAVGVSPVYLTQTFAQVEGMPLYRYQLRLRLARALDLLGTHDDLSAVALEAGFSSHSHFSSAFRQVYGRTPAAFQRAFHLR